MRKNFSARHVAFDEQRRRLIDHWGGRAIPPDEHLMVLEDHLSTSLRRRNNPYPLLKLQLALLMDLVDAENSVAACKEKIAELERAPEASSTQAKLESVKAELQKFTAIRRALRDIGDGMAWRLLGCDRAALEALAAHPRKPHINLSGLQAELNALADEYNQPGKRLGILNDLTHFLKKADITVRVDESTFEFLEVKSSRTKSGTLRRQRADLQETLRFLSAGEGERDGETVVIRELPVTPSSLMKAVAPLVREAERTGTAATLIGDHLVVEFVDVPKALEGDDSQFAKLEKVEGVVDGWRRRGDLVLSTFGTDRYLDVRNYAPYSIYPLTPLQRVKLMTASLVAVSKVNLSAVIRYIESRGWTVVRGPESWISEYEAEGDRGVRGGPLSTFRKGPLTMAVPGPWVGRLAFEYLAPRTIVDALEAVLAARHVGTGVALPVFAGEAAQWE
jgi:hypothetical protein